MGLDQIKLAKGTDELKKLIAMYPDYPIVVLAGEEANDGDHSWTYCGEISFGIDEILDANFTDNNDCVFTDRDSLEEYIEETLYDEFCEKPEEEYTAAIKAKIGYAGAFPGLFEPSRES